MLIYRDEETQHGDHNGVSRVSPKDTSPSREVHLDTCKSTSGVNTVPRIYPKHTRELYVLFNDLSHLSRTRNRPVSLVLGSRQWKCTSPRKSWESRRLSLIRNRNSIRRQSVKTDTSFSHWSAGSSSSASNTDSETENQFSIECKQDVSTGRHSSVIIRNTTLNYHNDTLDSLKISYNRKPAFPINEEKGIYCLS